MGSSENTRESKRLPKVSAIVPCFNRGQFIGQTIESILAQTYPNIEIVVIDDGCTDGSREILETFAARGVLKVLEHPGRENRGQSAGINLGLANTTGDYVGILDSDDLWLPEKVDEQVIFLETHPEIGLVYGNGEAIDSKGRHLYAIYRQGHHESNHPERVLLDCYFFVPTNSLVRRTVFNKTGGFDESLRASQDHDMAIRIAEAAKLAYVDRKWFRYRRHDASISRNNANLRWVNGFTILEKASQRFPYAKATLRKRRGVLHFRLGQCHIESRQWLRAGAHMLQAFWCDPLRAFRVVLGGERVSSPH